MARISKDPIERRLEIMKAAERLFNERGFENTAVSDIVQSIGVAQGTFYYYFKSKDDVFSAIAEDFFNEYLENFTMVVNNDKLKTIEKLEIVFDKGLELMENNEGLMNYLHTRGNIELHEKVEKKFIEYVTPMVIRIVGQGIEEKLFNVDFPEEVVTFLMMGSHFLGDLNIYLEDRELYLKRLQAVAFVVQRVLGVDSVTMDYFMGKFMDKFIKLLPN
ncbi:MAG: TetR/AcrR family transcriptional regulator [Pseudomonadota bacterium]